MANSKKLPRGLMLLFSRACRYDADLDSRFSSWSFEKEVNAAGLSVVPGLVDAHTHPVWVGDRVNEFAMKVQVREMKGKE